MAMMAMNKVIDKLAVYTCMLYRFIRCIENLICAGTKLRVSNANFTDSEQT